MALSHSFRCRLALLFLFCSLLPIVQSQRACYWPDGSSTASSNNNYIACDAEGVSHCCGQGEACLSNGLCFDAEIGLVCAICVQRSKQELIRMPNRCIGAHAQIKPGPKTPPSALSSALKVWRLVLKYDDAYADQG